MSSEGLKVRDNANKEFISLETPDGANSSIGVIDGALKIVNKQRADLGAYQNRLEMAAKGIGIGAENLQAAESTIRDANMAKEIVSYTKDNILMQSATSMLAQANAKSQSVLQLLG
jgi:flagellin